MNVRIFSELFSKEMTRKEFLLHMGVLFLAITGVSGLLKTLSDPHIVTKHIRPNTGFGTGRYGG